jgi:exopolyphosphatase / guanosine-5'-triphosphate,3'-diphosphate pyrophosphatase
MPVASVDMGSNTVRLMVADRAATGGIDVLFRSQVITRLGEGMGGSRWLSDRAMARTGEALGGFKNEWERIGVTRYRAVATSAVREAENADEFIGIAGDKGVLVEVISGLDEARLVMDGISPTISMSRGTFVTIDIGGGSTEFILVINGLIRDIISTGLGVVRLTERFLPDDPPERDGLERLSNFVENEIDRIYNKFNLQNNVPSLVGTAGTVTTLAAVHRGLESYDPVLVEGHLLDDGFIHRILDEFLGMTGRQRLARYPIIQEGRQDVIIAGLVILKVIMNRFGSHGIRVSDRGLLEGIIEGLL